MELTTSNVLAALSLVVALSALWNSYRARHQNYSDALYELRRTSLAKVRELEIEWQGVLNDLNHFSQRVKNAPGPESVRDSILSWAADIRPTFERSHQHVKEMRKKLEASFETVSASEARRYLREFEDMSARLKATRAEIGRKLDMLLEKAA